MKNVLKIIAVGLLIFIIGGLGGVFLNYMLFSKIITNPELSQNPLIKALDQRVQIIKSTEKIIVADNESIADIASRASASVVYVESIDEKGVRTSGNGTIISGDGVIATTTAVVPKDSTIQYIKLSDGNVYDVKDVFVDEYTGIVFLRIDATNLSTISFASSDDARSGKRLIAISHFRENDESIFALGGFLGQNYIFSIDAPMSDFLQGVLYLDFSQTAFSQSVGAPAVDFHGNMIGLITHKNSEESNQKEYYAIAANDVNQAFDNFLKKNNESAISQNNILLGIDYTLVTNLDAHIDNMSITAGAIVQSPKTYMQQQLFANSVAARSGIEAGDIIVTINNETINTKNNLSRLMHKYSSTEEEITLQILRNEDIMSVKIVQGEL